VADSGFKRPGERASSPEIPEQDEDFPSTIWLRVESAKDPERPQAREALGELCEAYWQPVYTFIRRKGHDPDQALDLTQGFFALLVEPGALGAVTPAKGKFRSFLMAACSHFLSNQRVYERALKRGGGRRQVSIDHSEAESRMRHEPFHELTPERAFVRQWALTLLDRTMAQLEAEASSKSKSSLFELVKPAILETGQHASYAEIGAKLDTTEAVVKVAVHRYRNRFRTLLRQEIARTVDDPADIEEEINTLIRALAN
jgi:DNA-directed RNA polymerase specialized sigma24 family protein